MSVIVQKHLKIVWESEKIAAFLSDGGSDFLRHYLFARNNDIIVFIAGCIYSVIFLI